MKSKRGIWHNGEMKDESFAKFSIYSEAAMRGYIFEMTRSFNKVSFKLKEHLERLFRSAKYIGLKIPYTIDELIGVCENLIVVNEFEDDDEHRLIINAYGGNLSIYGDVLCKEAPINVMIADIPLRWTVRGMSSLYDDGINAIIPNQKVIPSSVLDNRIKHHNRLHFARANMEVSELPGINNWPLLTDNNNYICEFTGANFFMIKNNVLYTPKPINILEGISREYVMKELSQNVLLGEVGMYRSSMKVVEADILPYDIMNADEAFSTCTPFCIIPVTKINGIPIGSGKPGYLTKRLTDLWSKNVGVDIIGQIKKWNENTVVDENFVSPYVTKKEK